MNLVLADLPSAVDFGTLSSAQNWIRPGLFYTRAQYVYTTTDKPAKVKYTNNNSPFDCYNPSTSAQLYCFICEKWCNHSDATKKVLTVSPVKVGTLASRASKLAVLRGGGWLSLYPKAWEVVDQKFDPDASSAWLVIGTFKLRSGIYNTVEHSAAAYYVDKLSRGIKFQCKFCEVDF